MEAGFFNFRASCKWECSSTRGLLIHLFLVCVTLLFLVLVVLASSWKTYYCNGLQRTHSFLCALCYMVCRVGVKKKWLRHCVKYVRVGVPLITNNMFKKVLSKFSWWNTAGPIFRFTIYIGKGFPTIELQFWGLFLNQNVTNYTHTQ